MHLICYLLFSGFENFTKLPVLWTEASDKSLRLLVLIGGVSYYFLVFVHTRNDQELNIDTVRLCRGMCTQPFVVMQVGHSSIHVGSIRPPLLWVGESNGIWDLGPVGERCINWILWLTFVTYSNVGQSLIICLMRIA